MLHIVSGHGSYAHTSIIFGSYCMLSQRSWNLQFSSDDEFALKMMTTYVIMSCAVAVFSLQTPSFWL